MAHDASSTPSTEDCGCRLTSRSHVISDISDFLDIRQHRTNTQDLASSATIDMHVEELARFSNTQDFCIDLLPSRRTSDKPSDSLDWTPSIIGDECGTPDELPNEYLAAVQLSDATHRPPSYNPDKRRTALHPPDDPNDIIRRLNDNCPSVHGSESTILSKTPGPLADHIPNSPEQDWQTNVGLRYVLNIAPPQVAPTVTGMAPADLIDDCFDYLYTAWVTVVAALASSRRVRRQWWYYRDNGADTPGWWVGRYGPAKLQKLADALTIACARMTGGIYYNEHLPDLSYVIDMSTGACVTGTNDCEVAGSELRVCANFSHYSAENQRIGLMAALLANDVTRNRGTLAVATGHYSDDDLGDDLIRNAYNIAHWVMHRFNTHGWQTREPSISWDIRPDKSHLPLFEARIPRVYHVWPAKDINHTQLRRAWDESWCYAEAAFRFLYKLTYMTEQQIEDMWNFGTDANPDRTPRFFVGERQREAIEDPNRNIPPVLRSTDEVVPSMRNFFGIYSRERFLLVYRVVLCLCLRYENNYTRGSTHLTQKFRLYPGNGKSYGAVAFPTGEVDLHKKWFDGNDEYRARTINHELMHYLIKWQDGGRPRDWKSPSLCGTSGGNKCYAIEECLALAAVNDSRCRSNNNNYSYWLLYRWRRWGSDWPPSYDIGPDETWHNDPISDSNWDNHTYGSVVEIGWERLDVMEHRFGLEGYMPWD